MSAIKVKICGTTTPRDGVLAAEAGADAIGLIFAPGSKRHISAAQARDISLAVGPVVARVGVFLGQGLDEVLRTAEAARLSSVQLHGSPPGLYIEQICRYYPVLLALRPQDLGAASGSAVVTLLIDAPQPGSGQPLDWAALAPQFPAGSWLAGGLGPENVGEAIGLVRPAGVDAVSRLECQPGVKDPSKVKAFVQAVRRAEGTIRQDVSTKLSTVKREPVDNFGNTRAQD